MLEPGESCSAGNNIVDFDECESAGKSLGMEFVAVKNNLQNCYATKRNFGGGEQKEICKGGGGAATGNH
jgi:hypothetical protein